MSEVQRLYLGDGSVSPAFELRAVSAWYGNARIIFDASLSVNAGEVVALIGRNGAGKTSLLRSRDRLDAALHRQRVAGWRGRQWASAVSTRKARSRLRARGSAHLYRSDGRGKSANRKPAIARAESPSSDLLALFPNLADMLQRPASAMSGGEQQMLAVARTLAANPSVVLLDEPSEGIAPLVVAKMREAVLAMKARGVATLVSEQNVRFAAAIADRAVLIEQGRVIGEATRAELLAPSESVQRVLALGGTAPTIHR